MIRKKKHTLTFEQEYNFDMIGLCSHHSDYRLVWGINEQLGLRLVKSKEDYVATNKKGEVISSHSISEFVDEENRLEFYLIKNKTNNKFLIPEKPSMDYFLFLVNNIAIDVDDLAQDLKKVQSILGIYPFDPEELESTQNLVFN